MTDLIRMLSEHGASVGTIAAAIYAGWKARGAEKYAKPTGNGFAGVVKDHLIEIKADVKETSAKIDAHLADHAAAHVRKRK